MDTAGRVERFNKRRLAHKATAERAASASVKKAKK